MDTTVNLTLIVAAQEELVVAAEQEPASITRLRNASRASAISSF